jgi:hypothetical protein
VWQRLTVAAVRPHRIGTVLAPRRNVVDPLLDRFGRSRSYPPPKIEAHDYEREGVIPVTELLAEL